MAQLAGCRSVKSNDYNNMYLSILCVYKDTNTITYEIYPKGWQAQCIQFVNKTNF